MKPLELPAWQVWFLVIMWAGVVGVVLQATLHDPFLRPYKLSWRVRLSMEFARIRCEAGHDWVPVMSAEEPVDSYSGPCVHSICRRCGIMSVAPDAWENLRKGSL